MTIKDFDILIVGSGPSGAHAAWTAVKRGLRVAMIDVGHTESRFDKLIPNKPFSEILATETHCKKYLLGEGFFEESGNKKESGAQLTPPRQFIFKDSDRYLPIRSKTFQALQSLALGGLAAGWGGGAATFEDWELKKCGLDPLELQPYYAKVAGEIGISGPKNDDTSPHLSSIQNLQAPLEIDTNGEMLLRTYKKKRAQFLKAGFKLGRPPLAILSQPLGDRQANPYFDMDFYHDPQRSLYRPAYTVEALKSFPNFFYFHPILTEKFVESEAGKVTVWGQNLINQDVWTLTGRRLLLAAGAINTARIVLRSLNRYGQPVPILCNPYSYLPSLHLPMLGKSPRDRRHSMAQLTGLLFPSGDPGPYIRAQFYSYRSLLPQRLAKKIPLPTPMAILLAKGIQSWFWLIGVTHEDKPSPKRFMELRKEEKGKDFLFIQYQRTAEELELESSREKMLKGYLRKLRCFPLKRLPQAPGASIHYAGTLPFSEREEILTCQEDGKVRGTKNVYAVDGAPFLYLPAKDFAFTLMANAQRVADIVANGLES